MSESDSRERAGTDHSPSVMHVLRAPVGGLFRHVGDLAREQCSHGHRVGIICDSSTGNDFSLKTLDALGATCELGVHRMPMSRMPGIADIGIVRNIRGIVREAAPQIVHGHGAKGAAYARMVARGVGAKAVFTPHGGSLHYTSTSLSGAVFLSLERLLKSRTDGVIFESAFAKHTFEKNVGAITCASRVIHNGLYDDEFTVLNSDAAEYDFVFIGEIRALKGIRTLLDAIEMEARDSDFSVLIVGDGDQESYVNSRIAECGLQDRVTVSPAIHPATRALEKARCMLMPSLGESLPYIVLECLAAGVPILATGVGGIPEIFGSFSSNLLPPGDAKALAAALRNFLLEPEVAGDVAASLRNLVRNKFTVRGMTSDTTDFYRELSAPP